MVDFSHYEEWQAEGNQYAPGTLGSDEGFMRVPPARGERDHHNFLVDGYNMDAIKAPVGKRRSIVDMHTGQPKDKLSNAQKTQEVYQRIID